MNKIIKKYAEIDYTGCCGASGKEYYELLCPEYFSGNDELETSLEQVLEKDLEGGCSQCCGSLKVLDELENADFLVSDTVDYTKNKKTIVFKDNWNKEYSSYSLKKLIDSLKNFEMENQPKHYLSLKYRTLSLELENIDKTRFKGDLCLCPELIDNKTMVLKGFLEEIVSNESKKDINYYSENYKTITLEKNWRYEYYSKSIASFLGDIEIVEEKNQSNIEKLNDMKILLELEDLNGMKVVGYLSFYPEFDKDMKEDDRERKVVLKGLVEEIINNI